MIPRKDQKHATHFSHLRMICVEFTDHYNKICKHMCSLKLISQCIYSFVPQGVNKGIKKNRIQSTSSNINSSRLSLILNPHLAHLVISAVS